ncbi:factor-independent urate hydroxylase [Streptomyces aidingensis]|uniref:Uricase n=1 Tax=Streptomyces aidingensis TaxID=910347 RepID=A0A1I1IUI9_9ACTN|nr:urate oxidase [Streptomyces aidingensis]SFC39382.1 urate oxidase [Streptomyces aidingensis]
MPADLPPPGRPALLGQNQYGKAETRVVRVTREGRTHHIRDLSVSVALSGDLDDTHYAGRNAAVLPTDTAKNTVFAFAKEYGIDSAEQFGILLARHFVTATRTVRRARVRIEEYAWDRIGPAAGGTAAGEPARHSFVRRGDAVRTAQISYDGDGWEVLGGLKHLTVLNSTDSEFHGFLKDRYTTLREAYDRVLATEISAWWRHRGTLGGPTPGEPDHPAAEGAAPDDRDWDACWHRARSSLLDAFATTYSHSLQQTLYQMGARVLADCPGIEEIRLSLPNKHHFPVDLTPFGLTNDNEVYFAADRPYGLIEATVLRPGAAARIPADLTNLP